jgi:hypothetical protein
LQFFLPFFSPFQLFAANFLRIFKTNEKTNRKFDLNNTQNRFDLSKNVKTLAETLMNHTNFHLPTLMCARDTDVFDSKLENKLTSAAAFASFFISRRKAYRGQKPKNPSSLNLESSLLFFS